MESGIYLFAAAKPPRYNLPKAGDFHADGAGPLFSTAKADDCVVLFEGILTRGGQAGRNDADITLQVYRKLGLEGLKDLEGFFQLAVLDLKQKRALVVSDPMATRPLYIYRTRGVAAIAPTPWFFADCGLPMTLDRQGLYQSFRFYHPLAWRTLVNEVSRSRPLTVYEIHTDGRVEEQRPDRWAKDPDASIDLDGAADQIKEIMRGVLSGVVNHPLIKERSIILPLTAGQDSRHILGELIEQERSPDRIRHVKFKQNEYQPVEKIARDLGIPLDAPPIAEVDHAELTRKWVRRTAGLVNFHQSHLMGVAENTPGDVIGFDGYLCDHFLGLNRRPGMPAHRNFTPFSSRLLFSDAPELSRQCDSEVGDEFATFEGPENFRVRMFDAFNRGVQYTGAVFPVMGDQALFFAPGAHRLALEFCRRVPEKVAAWKRARLRMFQRYFPRLASFPSEYGPPFSETEVQYYKKPSKVPAIMTFGKGLLTLHRATDPAPGTNHEWLRRIPVLKNLHRRVVKDSALVRDKHLPAHVPSILFRLHQAGASFAFTLMTLTTAEVAYRSLVMGESAESICEWLTG